MANRNLLGALISVALICGMTLIGCKTPPPAAEPEKPVDNTIHSVSISLSDGDAPKVGEELTAAVKNKDGSSVSGVSYQWKRGDSPDGTFENIDNAASSRYTPVIEDAGKYIKVEAENSSTSAPVESVAVGPAVGDQVAKPEADIVDEDVVPGQEITLASATENAVIYYTLDGTTPTSDSTAYDSDSKLQITSNCTLQALATRDGMVDSEILSVTYSVVPPPSFSSVTSSAPIFSAGIFSAAYGNNRFVAGGNVAIAYSANGTTWTQAAGADASFSGFGLVRGIVYGKQFVAVGYNSSGGAINYSSDGASWNGVTTTTFGASYINDVAYGSEKYVAVGKDGKMAYSSDGKTWTAVSDSTFGTSEIIGITYGAEKFIAVGVRGKMAYSDDGTTWTAVSDSAFGTYMINGVTYGGAPDKERFVAVGGSLGPCRIAYSTDGITWTSVSQDISVDSVGNLNRVVWDGSRYVAVAASGVMLFSLDGTYWARIDGGTDAGKSQFGTDSYINDIVCGGEKLLAVGSKNSSLDRGEMAISK